MRCLARAYGLVAQSIPEAIPSCRGIAQATKAITDSCGPQKRESQDREQACEAETQSIRSPAKCPLCTCTCISSRSDASKKLGRPASGIGGDREKMRGKRRGEPFSRRLLPTAPVMSLTRLQSQVVEWGARLSVRRCSARRDADSPSVNSQPPTAR